MSIVILQILYLYCFSLCFSDILNLLCLFLIAHNIVIFILLKFNIIFIYNFMKKNKKNIEFNNILVILHIKNII